MSTFVARAPSVGASAQRKDQIFTQTYAPESIVDKFNSATLLIGALAVFATPMASASPLLTTTSTSDGADMGIAANASATQEIPTSLDNPQTPSDPNGACSKCRAGTMADPVAGTNGSVEIYYADDGQNFDGDIEMRILLNSGQVRYATISDVTLTDQTTDNFSVAPGTDWEWSNVDHVWVQALPA